MTSTEPVVIATRTTLLPAGADPTDQNAWDFALHIEYRGEGAWVVLHMGSKELSRAGHWGWSPQPFRRHQYRFDTRDDALAAAATALPEVTVAGTTWAQWRDQRVASPSA